MINSGEQRDSGARLDARILDSNGSASFGRWCIKCTGGWTGAD